MSAGSGRPCSICGHPQRAEIERELLGGTSFRKVAARYETTPQSLIRHRNAHMSRSIVAAAQHEAREVEQAHDASLLDQVRDLSRRALEMMAEARSAGDLRTALSGVSAATKLLELQGKFLGQIAPTTVNVLVTQEFKVVQVALLSALEAHPQAKADVLAALARIQ